MTRTLALALLPFAAVACSNGFGTGAMLSVDYFGDTDVVGFAFTIKESTDTACKLTGQGLDDQTYFVDLVDGIFPGQIDHVEDYFDPETRHLGSDLFASMTPGCYDVTATPLSKIPASVSDYETKPADFVSDSCSTTKNGGVNVESGKTSEVELVSQCEGDGAGALDSLVLINHPPTLLIETFEKYNYECEITRVCATGYDINDDKVKFEWEKTKGAGMTKGDGKGHNVSAVSGYPKIVGFDDGHRIWEDCVDVWTKYTDTHEFSVTIFDLAADGKKMEDKLEDWGVPSGDAESHFEMTFPWHTNWIEDPMCFDSTGTLVEADGVDITRTTDSVCKPTSAEAYYCNAADTYKVGADVRKFLCEDSDSDGKYDTLDEEALYPECPS